MATNSSSRKRYFNITQMNSAAKVRFVINHLNCAFQASLENSDSQSVDEHMIKFKGKSSMKQYIKSKPIKWGFKMWFRCCSKTGYVYQFDIYLGRKTATQEYNLGKSVVLQLCEKLNGSYCQVFFDNFFTSPRLIKQLFENGIYAMGTARVNRKNMPRRLKVSEVATIF